MASEDSDESSTKKAPRKEPAKKAAKKSTARGGSESGDGNERSSARSSAPKAAGGRKRSGLALAAEAAQQLGQLTGRDVEAVTAVERTDDGWRVDVEVLEVRRIPDTTDVLATYELMLDSDGDIDGYRRVRRYIRGTPGEEQDR